MRTKEERDCWNASHPGRNDKSRHGGLRLAVLQRDHYTCQVCGMTDQQHRKTFGKAITVDHKQGGGRYAEVKDHRIENLWTLCLVCHGKKDGKLAWTKRKPADQCLRGHQLPTNRRACPLCAARRYQTWIQRHGKRSQKIA